MNNDYNNQNQNNQGQYSSYGQYPPVDLFGQSQSPFFDPYTQNGAIGMQKAAKAKNTGIVALVASILSFFISPLIGVVLGILALVNASSAKKLIGFETADTKTARTLGIASIIISLVVFAISFVLLLMLAIFYPELYAAYFF